VSFMPINPKVTASGVASMVTVLVVYILSAGFGIVLPPEVASAITGLIAVAAGYLKAA